MRKEANSKSLPLFLWGGVGGFVFRFKQSNHSSGLCWAIQFCKILLTYAHRTQVNLKYSDLDPQIYFTLCFPGIAFKWTHKIWSVYTGKGEKKTCLSLLCTTCCSLLPQGPQGQSLLNKQCSPGQAVEMEGGPAYFPKEPATFVFLAAFLLPFT